MSRIDRFIDKFKQSHNSEALIDTFLNGNCYHFSWILKGLFEGEMVYDMENLHFLFRTADGILYDIRGAVDDISVGTLTTLDALMEIDYDWYLNLLYNSMLLDTKTWEEMVK